jgi:hypothetical protein
MTKRAEINPNAMYRARDGLSGTIAGAPVTVPPGAQVPGTHPLVEAYPWNFVGEGIPPELKIDPSNEYLREAGRAKRERDADRQRRLPGPPPGEPLDPGTPLSELMVATATVTHGELGYIKPGQVLLASDPRVEHFQPKLACFVPLREVAISPTMQRPAPESEPA